MSRKYFMHDVAKERELELIDTKHQLRRALRSIRIWRRRALEGLRYMHGTGVAHNPGNWGEVIDDGFGNVWSAVCPDCGGDMEIVRPGKVQCSRDCWAEHD